MGGNIWSQRLFFDRFESIPLLSLAICSFILLVLKRDGNAVTPTFRVRFYIEDGSFSTMHLPPRSFVVEHSLVAVNSNGDYV